MSATVRYSVRPQNLHEHLFEVEVVFPVSGKALLEAYLPVWTPGSYLVREFSRHVQQAVAEDGKGAPLPLTRVDKNTWRVEPGAASEVRLRYLVYANELTVRTSHLDGTHGYFNGANLFVTSDEHRAATCELSVDSPAGWKVFCALPRQGNTFTARDFDELVDSPVEVGPHAVQTFTAAGKPHDLVFWGRGNHDAAQVARDLAAICEAEAKIFGGVPFERYLFLVLLGDKRGGLEHAASTSLLFSRFGFRPRKSYEDFLSLAAHEYFHLWNVKRIKPRALVPFDYRRENYTRLLWAFEGMTSYYDTHVLRRAALIDGARYLVKMGEAVSAVESVPSRKVQSLAEASLCAWIKYYRQDENTANSGTSYYVKGEVVAMLLDLHLRAATQGKRSLDDLMRLLWERFGKGEGVPEDGVEAIARELGGEEVAAFLSRAVHTTEELDYGIFEAAGLTLKRRTRESSADRGGTAGDAAGKVKCWLGCELKGSDAATVSVVYTGGPAAAAGLSAGDEIVACDGFRVDATTILERFDEKGAGQKVKLSFFRADELLHLEATLAERQRDACWIEKLPGATGEQKALYEAWLSEPFDAPKVS